MKKILLLQMLGISLLANANNVYFEVGNKTWFPKEDKITNTPKLNMGGNIYFKGGYINVKKLRTNFENLDFKGIKGKVHSKYEYDINDKHGIGMSLDYGKTPFKYEDLYIVAPRYIYKTKNVITKVGPLLTSHKDGESIKDRKVQGGIDLNLDYYNKDFYLGWTKLMATTNKKETNVGINNRINYAKDKYEGNTSLVSEVKIIIPEDSTKKSIQTKQYVDLMFNNKYHINGKNNFYFNTGINYLGDLNFPDSENTSADKKDLWTKLILPVVIGGDFRKDKFRARPKFKVDVSTNGSNSDKQLFKKGSYDANIEFNIKNDYYSNDEIRFFANNKFEAKHLTKNIYFADELSVGMGYNKKFKNSRLYVSPYLWQKVNFQKNKGKSLTNIEHNIEPIIKLEYYHNVLTDLELYAKTETKVKFGGNFDLKDSSKNKYGYKGTEFNITGGLKYSW